MAQPEYVPVNADDRVRPAERLPVPDRWVADRPGEIRGVGMPTGPRLGSPGPDQGYGLKLARSFVEAGKLVLTQGEHAEDAVAGCLGVALKRASMFGRAPVIYDFELAYAVWGFLDAAAPRDLVEFRKPLFQSVSHDYWDQREIADQVPDSTLRMQPAAVRTALDDWRSLLAV